MKRQFLFSILLFNTASSYAGIGYGKITDITIRTQDSVLVVRTTAHDEQPACATWAHSLGVKYDGTKESSRALYSMFLAAKASGETIRIAGTGSCLPGIATEEILEANIGPWGS